MIKRIFTFDPPRKEQGRFDYPLTLRYLSAIQFHTHNSMNRPDSRYTQGAVGRDVTDQAAVITRRRFIRQTLLGTAALFLAPVLPTARVRAHVLQATASTLRYFSDEEYFVFSAAAARLTGHVPGEPDPAGTVDTALRADTFLSNEDPEIQDQIHLLLTIFNSPVSAFLFNFKFSGFVNMDAAGQDSYLEGWMTSSLGFRRTGFQALKRLSMSMHYTDERSWEEIGYHGVEVPEGVR